MDNFPRILVTGGAGFIGGALIRKLLTDSNCIIYNIDNLNYASDLRGIKNLENSKNRHFHLNVNLKNLEKTQKAVEDANPDIIFHLAAESHVDRSITSPKIFIDSNIVGTFNLLEASRYHWEMISDSRKRKFRFIHISTDEVFGSLNKPNKFNENSNYDPRSPYSASKAASDHLAKAWFHTYNLPTIITNCSNNYGPFQFPEKLIPKVILNALKGEKIPIYGDGRNIRDWLYVEDHIEALLLVAKKGKAGETYCIGNNNERNNNYIVKEICSILETYKPKRIPYLNQIEYVKDRPGHDKRYAIDATKIKTELGWNPKINLQNGLSRTIKWYIDNIEWCQTNSKK
tara:strand:- start:418 stop:1449 length:1032 start_codon:yes stop_codon:yes gene_type:complete